MSEIEITGVFENVLGMIYSAKQKAEYQVNSTIIDLYWSIINDYFFVLTFLTELQSEYSFVFFPLTLYLS